MSFVSGEFSSIIAEDFGVEGLWDDVGEDLLKKF